MTTHDTMPENSSAEFEASSRELRAVLEHNFERPFETFGYTADFSFYPDTNADMYHPGPARDYVQASIDLPLSTSRPWGVKLGYNPQTERLDIISADIPIGTEYPEDTIVFQKMQAGYYMMMRRQADDQARTLFMREEDKLEAMVYNTTTARAINEIRLKNLLYAAGYALPELFTSPNDLQLHTTETLSRAAQWSRRESIVVPVSVDQQIILNRETMSRRRESERNEYDSSLTAIIEDLAGETRKQLVIDFQDKEHWTGAPNITLQSITPARDPATIANYGPDAYTVRKQASVTPTVELMDRLIEDLLDDLGD